MFLVPDVGLSACMMPEERSPQH